MKKIVRYFLVVMLLLSSAIVFPDSGVYKLNNTGEESINTNIEVRFIDPTKGEPKGIMFFDYKYDLLESSSSERRYLYSKYTWKSDRIVQYNSKEEISQRHFGVATRGYSFTTSESTTTSGTVSFNGSYSTAVKNTINAGFGLDDSGSYTATVSKDQSFSFPSKYDDTDYTKVDFYVAIGYDKYEFTLNKIDVYQTSTSKWGVTTEEIYDEPITVEVHRPKRLILEIPGYN